MGYTDFLAKKAVCAPEVGFEVAPEDLNSALFGFQRQLVRWALRRGKAALFERVGLGKTIQQLEWARCVHEHTGGDVLILTPLAVAEQTRREGE
jgi:SNF2 family DNA or RNA helicase